MRVRTAGSVCKRPARPLAGKCGWLLIAFGAWAWLWAACSLPPAPKAITVAALEGAPLAVTADVDRIVVSDPKALRDICTPLGPRLGLLQVGSPREWRRLAQVAGQVGPCPDFRDEMLIGVACWAGTPVDGQWPVRIEAVKVREGAGLVKADFRVGSYLPDGRAFLEMAHVSGLTVVVAVDVNGTTFYPE